MARLRDVFLALIMVQALHSVEEYRGGLYEVFPPARFVSGLISQNLEHGFVIFNVALVGFGLWCFLEPIRRGWPSAVFFVWLWVALELVNGVGHLSWTLAELRYTPGVATAPFLLVLALYLVWQLRGSSMKTFVP